MAHYYKKRKKGENASLVQYEKYGHIQENCTLKTHQKNQTVNMTLMKTSDQ